VVERMSTPDRSSKLFKGSKANDGGEASSA
jgi:hypothetical protein